ncbi:MAG: hypothetical protein R2834_20425 [Rhodothermales bacterium]
MHIGIHVARGVMGEFRRRQWEAQVGVLFPFIEQRRLQLIDLLSHSIPLPTSRSRNGFTQEITRPDELELSNMLDFLRSASGVESELIETVGKLKAMRDALAHQETVSNHEIAHPYAAIIRRARTEYSPTASIRRV